MSTFLYFAYEAELQNQQQQFMAQLSAQRQLHVALTEPPLPQKATVVYRSQQVPLNDQAVPKNGGEGKPRGRACRHDGRYTSGKLMILHGFLFAI